MIPFLRAGKARIMLEPVEALFWFVSPATHHAWCLILSLQA